MLQIEIKEKKSRLIADLPDEIPDPEILKEIQEKLSYVDETATRELWRINRKARTYRTFVYKKLFNLKTKIFYTGLTPYVIEILNTHKFEYEINDLREKTEAVGIADLPIDLSDKEIWPFQQKAVE